MKLTFVAIIPNHWGKGNTPDKAMANAMKEAGSRKRQTRFMLYVTNDPECYVDDFGGFCYHTSEGMWVTRIDSEGKQDELWPITLGGSHHG